MGSSSNTVTRKSARATRTAAAGVVTRFSRYLSGLSSTLVVVLCCSCARLGVRSNGVRVVSRGCTQSSPRALRLSVSRLRQAATSACTRGVAFCAAGGLRIGGCTASGSSSSSWSSSSWTGGVLATATTAYQSEDRTAVGRRGGVWMKANKKNKKKRQQRQEGDSDGGGGGGGGAKQPKPQRVTKDAPVSVRTQIKYAKMKKSMEKSHKSSKKVVHNKYRRVKPLDYEDIVEPEDLSHIYMPDIAPSLMVDGYNIMFYWSKCCMMADNGDLEGARQLLVEELDTVSAMRGWTVTVVFDAYKRKGGGKRKYVTPNKIEVVFTSNGESADMYVERLTEELKDAGCPNVMVATGDKLMQSLVVGAGAEVFSPDRIIEEIEICHREAVAYTDMYMRKKESMIEKSEMQDLLDRCRSVEEKAKRRPGGGGRGGKSGPTFNIEDDL